MRAVQPAVLHVLRSELLPGGSAESAEGDRCDDVWRHVRRQGWTAPQQRAVADPEGVEAAEAA